MSGVDQKISGTAVKSVGERNIPWSQQVDEASYENLSSPANDDNSGNQSSMQFQFPPFIVKENNHSSLSNTGKGRKASHNNDTKQKYGNPGSYNNPKRENHHINVWNSRRLFAESSASSNRINENDNGLSSKLDKRTGESVDEVKTHGATAAPKKTTWASIASQPAKLTSKTTFTTSSHKKKGPGMPPPPMVPGKHNLDVNVWDLPNSNPPPVPSPPLPIDLSSSEPNFSSTTRDESAPSVGNHSDRDECYGVASNSNACSAKPSPTSQTHKNWVAQQQQAQHTESRQGSGAPAPLIRRIVPTGNPIRYNERRGNFTGHRNDFEKNIKHEYRDENNPRIAQNSSVIEEVAADPQILLDELKDKNNYNPTEIDLDKAATARFFVIKSYSEDDIHRSIKYEIWCSTDHGNKRLDDAFKERYKEGGNVLLFFSKQEEEVSSKRPTTHVADVISQTQVPINRHFNRQNDDRERERNVRDSRSITINTTQKISISGGSNNNFRDRNLVHKSGTGSGNYCNSNSYNDYRRGFDREIMQSERENHFGTRHGSNRKEDHSYSHSTKARLNKRDFNTEPIKSDVRLRTGLSASRDLPKTNANDRMRNNDYL
ncbi:hypothetical protein ACLKA7_007897 [Drosophila subpalustris]